MTSGRLVCAALAGVVSLYAAGAWACDKDKTSAAAMTADASGHCSMAKSATAAACAGGASAVTASSSACAAKAGSAVAAGSHDCCAKGAATTASKATHSMKIMAANGAGHCSGTGMAGIASAALHDDCEACLDMTACSQALDAAHAHRQVVQLKNGVMLIYTADSPSQINAVQAAVSSRNAQVSRFAAAGDKAHLCGECKSIRGAMASGKLNREVVNIEGGILTLLTSNDPALVTRLHAMTADSKVATRIKS
jgi:hypothetical protein